MQLTKKKSYTTPEADIFCISLDNILATSGDSRPVVDRDDLPID